MVKYIGLSILLIIIVSAAFITYKSKNILPNLQTQTSTSLPNIESKTTSAGPTPKIPFILKPGYQIHVFASDLNKPRVLEFSPGGVLLTSDIGSNEVIAIPDKNNDGAADTKKIVINRGNHIHGIAFYKDKLYVAEVDKVTRYNWDEANLQATQDKVLFFLPQNENHNNRTLTFDKEGNMYVSVGSTCNVCVENSDQSATVLKSNADGDSPKVFATGLRNAPFTQINPKTGELWGTEMGRDNLGDNIPPDEINVIRQGKNYGWPYCYGDMVHDSNFDK
ncbi:MAG: PQQ-dependent sugar dehydrogenase, partial [Candidatus Curtissbacteria bacterium]|nr:PQQ-dependent sugar dehydrogenase [Candidatus Curtissbacteria bacterium]